MRASYENARTHRIIHNAYAARYHLHGTHVQFKLRFAVAKCYYDKCNMYQALTNKLEFSAMEGLVTLRACIRVIVARFRVFPIVRDIVQSYSIDPSILNRDFY